MKKILVGIAVTLVVTSLIGCASGSVISTEGCEEMSGQYKVVIQEGNGLN